ncbi:MAG: hypothetical protein IKS65_09575 [Bacteroidales bacterium]|nr:hypothetical protein [Bacteroidales bacterium]
MKKLFLIALISIVFANSMYSQQTITSITDGCRIKFFPDKKEFVFTSDEEEFSEEVFRFPLETASACLKKDVIKFYGLQKKYDTELKVSMFKKTDEYQELYENLCYYYEAMTNPNIKGYFFIQLDKETKYDLKQLALT